MRVNSNSGSTIGYEPNSYGEWQEQPDYKDPHLELVVLHINGTSRRR